MFSRYLSLRRDNNELLLFMLRQLIHDQRTFSELRRQAHGAPDGDEEEPIKISVRDLEDKVKCQIAHRESLSFKARPVRTVGSMHKYSSLRPSRSRTIQLDAVIVTEIAGLSAPAARG